MHKSRKIKFIIFPIVMILGTILLYEFMTYDRNYFWSKEFFEKIENIAKPIEFKVAKEEIINTNEIKLSKKKIIKLRIQKFLSKFDLMKYEKEFGEKITLKSKANEILFCKAWCLGDHVIGIEIESHNIDEIKLNQSKSIFENEFPNYKIVWTKH